MAEKKCNGCATSKMPESVPYMVHEDVMVRAERQAKRLWVIILVLIALLFGTNIAWIVYESQFEEVETYEEIIIDAEDDGNANYIGNDGNIYNGEDYSKEEN